MVSQILRYTEEFKERAVELSQQDGRSIKEVAAELGIAPATLCNWRRKMGVSTPRKGPEAEKLREMRQELEELRRRTKQLEKEKKLAEMERDILKKATAFFARDHK